MKTKAITVTAAAIGIIALAGCGSTVAKAPAAKPATATTSAIPAVPAAAQQTPPPPPSQADQIAAWAASPGYDAMMTVQADLTQMSADADAEDALATETDGATLAADAQIAEDSPPPVGTGTYAAAMQAYVSAGNDAASGEFDAATVNINEGTALINRTTTAVTNAGS